MVGSCRGAGLTLVPGRPTNLDISRARAQYACNKCGYGVVWTLFSLVSWLVGCFGLNGPLRQYFRLYRAVTQRGRTKREKDIRKKKCPNRQ